MLAHIKSLVEERQGSKSLASGPPVERLPSGFRGAAASRGTTPDFSLKTSRIPLNELFRLRRLGGAEEQIVLTLLVGKCSATIVKPLPVAERGDDAAPRALLAGRG